MALSLCIGMVWLVARAVALVPLPASISGPTSPERGTVRLLPDQLHFTVAEGDSPDLQAAIERYRALIYTHGAHNSSSARLQGAGSALTTVAISVKEVVRTPQLHTDESYTLNVPAAGAASISANTTVGAYRALETLSQLANYDFEDGSYRILGAPLLIHDYPRFAWRGLMIDTSRHWLPVASILRTLDAMSYAKLSVLHWHIVDREAFPVVLESVPELAKGAWSAQEKYSVSDIKQIVEAARLRGIRVVPEIDVPTHTASWCVGMPELCPHQPVVWNASHKGGRFDCGACSPCEPLDPTNPEVFTVLTKVFAELASLFPDAVFHQGADEVLDPAENNFAHMKCWESSPRIRAWLEKNFPGAEERHGDNAYVWFVDQISNILRNLGKRPMLWDDPYRWPNKTLAVSSTIVQAYRAKDACAQAADQGHGVVVSPMGVYYLRGEAATWQRVYDWEPLDYCQAHGNMSRQKLILGGEAAMCMYLNRRWVDNWPRGEQLDSSDMDRAIWPRAAAIGERLWTPPGRLDNASAQARLGKFRCLLNARGIGASEMGQTAQITDKQTGAKTTTPAAFSGLPPGPSSCFQGARNRTSPAK